MHGNLGRLNPNLAPTVKATTHDIAWAAGIYEGEGCCECRGTGSEHALVSQKGRWVLDRLRELFGGSVGKRSGGLGGGMFVWLICGARARGFLQTIYGLLSPRRQEQALRTLQTMNKRKAQ